MKIDSKPMNVLVTGGAGFIGSNLVHFLLQGPLDQLPLEVGKVVTLDKLTYAGNLRNLDQVSGDPGHVFVLGDIGDRELVCGLLEEHQIDVVMHLAAESHVDRSIENPVDFVRTNVLGSLCLLECFRKHVDSSGRSKQSGYGRSLATGGNCLFLNVSTDEVFGSLEGDTAAFMETSAYAPNSPYSASKAGADHLVRAYHHTYGLPVITSNCSNNYGPFQFPEKLIPLMIRKALRGEQLPVYGDGMNIRDWLYVGDHCRALAMMVASGRPGSTYLVGGGCEMTNLDVVRAIIDVVAEFSPEGMDGSPEQIIRFVADRPGHDRRYAVNSELISKELGWRAKESFHSGLRKTVQWYLEHPDWIEEIERSLYRGERLGMLA
jgi:dTDP-glucose 4,6-dehydratase